MTTRQCFAFLLGFITVLLPALAYWDYPVVLGSHASEKLIALGALGGAASFTLYVERDERLVALVPGLLCGTCAVAALLYAPQLFPAPGSYQLWGLLGVVLGLAPGLALLWALRLLSANRKRKSLHAPTR